MIIDPNRKWFKLEDDISTANAGDIREAKLNYFQVKIM